MIGFRPPSQFPLKSESDEHEYFSYRRGRFVRLNIRSDDWVAVLFFIVLGLGVMLGAVLT